MIKYPHILVERNPSSESGPAVAELMAKIHFSPEGPNTPAGTTIFREKKDLKDFIEDCKAALQLWKQDEI